MLMNDEELKILGEIKCTLSNSPFLLPFECKPLPNILSLCVRRSQIPPPFDFEAVSCFDFEKERQPLYLTANFT